MQIKQNTKLNLVIGYPLEHSQSPMLHNALYETLQLNSVLLPAAHTDITALITVIKTLQINLTAVTMPFKEQVIPYLDIQSKEVEILQAANTIIQRDGNLYGYNTDIDGIAYALSSVTLTNKKILILGAGGAAKALGYVLQQHSTLLFWLNRTSERAQALADQFGGEIISNEKINQSYFDIIINTTPIGMHGHSQLSALPDYIFTPEQVVFDMVYNPLETPLLTQAKKAGAKLIYGIDMFIGQALRQIELWQNLENSLTNDMRINIFQLHRLLRGQ